MEQSTEWLTGLRGFASFVVFTNHYLNFHLEAPYRSFFTQPTDTYCFQFPPFRLFFASHAMVPLFMAISGYAISTKPLKVLNDSGASERLLHCLSSAAIRRVLGTYIPMLVLLLVAQIAFFCGLYKMQFPETFPLKPWTSPELHIRSMMRVLKDKLAVNQHGNSEAIHNQLWTMPVQLRGSLVVYLLIMALSTCKPAARTPVFILLMSMSYTYGSWDDLASIGGLCLAHRHLNPSVRADIKRHSGFARQYCSTLARTIALATGVYLLCLPVTRFFPPGYQMMSTLHPATHAWNSWSTIRSSWHTVGALMVLFTIDGSTTLQRLFQTRVLQSLGRLSFSIYLVHYMVIFIFGLRLRDAFWWILHGEPWPLPKHAWEYHPRHYVATICTSALGLIPITVFAAVLYRRFVDTRCAAFAHWASDLLTGSKRKLA